MQAIYTWSFNLILILISIKYGFGLVSSTIMFDCFVNMLICFTQMHNIDMLNSVLRSRIMSKANLCYRLKQVQVHNKTAWCKINSKVMYRYPMRLNFFKNLSDVQRAVDRLEKINSVYETVKTIKHNKDPQA